MPEEVRGLCQEILATPAPVLLLDACSVIDIARAPTLSRNQIGVVRTAARLVAMAGQTRPSAWLVIAAYASREFQQTIAAEAARTQQHIEQTWRSYRALVSVDHELRNVTTALTEELNAATMAGELRARAQRLHDACRILPAEDEIVIRATRRVADGRKPAGKGKYGDAEIFEHYLSVAQELRAADFKPGVWLVSSNTHDYGRPDSATPDADEEALRGELGASGLTHVTDIARAMIDIESRGQ